MSPPASGDVLHRFVFEGAGIRGELVQLDATWAAVKEIQDYPPTVATQLGQALVAAALLSATIKLDGSLIVQVQGAGPLHTLVAQASSRGTLRGLAQWRAEVPAGPDLETVFGAGRLVMTAEAPGGERYQGIVALEGTDLAAALGTYFACSEQLPTQVWLAAGAERASGLLLQRLPGADSASDDWHRVLSLAETLTRNELLSLAPRDLLYRLFHEEVVRLFEPEPLAFRCSCSRGRIEDTLRALGRAEAESIISADGEIVADCEFCNRRYRFDAVDVAMLFTEGVAAESADTH
jgi:molecular chaperone Hsp33